MELKTKTWYRSTKPKLIFQNNKRYKQTTDKTYQEDKEEDTILWRKREHN